MPGRATMGAGLLGLAILAPMAPGPGDPGFFIALAALVSIAAGAFWTARRLDSEGSGDLTGRVWATVIVAAVALLAAPRAKLFGDDAELAFLVVALVAGLAACGLFAWFVHGVHRRLREGRPVFLWAAAASLVVSIPVQNADLLGLVLYAIPLACVAIEVLRGSADPERSRAEAL